MQNDIANLLKERAAIIAKHALFTLREENPEDAAAINAFKFAYLLMRQPKAFLERFGVGNLYIDATEFDGFLWSLRGDLPYGDDLLPEEVELINEHNLECDAYLDSINNAKVIKLGR